MTTWNPKLYQDKHHFVTDYGRDLIPLLDPKPGERILDLGCGTGELTQVIADMGAEIVGMDYSSEMIARAKENFSNLEFILGDGQDFAFEEKFDAVFSNAALHWMPEPEKVIACIWEALKSPGRFIAEFGGKTNVATILDAIAQIYAKKNQSTEEMRLVNYFPSLAEYATLLEAQGFRVTHAFHFDRLTPLEGKEGLRNWVRMFRSQALEGFSEQEQEKFFKELEALTRERLLIDGIWHADYVRLRLRGVKNIP